MSHDSKAPDEFSRTEIGSDVSPLEAEAILHDDLRAALNLMEDAVEARRQTEQVNVRLRREIVEREHAESALRASENQMRLVTDNLPVYIAFCDAEERYRFVNAPYAERFGLRVEQVLGRRIEEVVGTQAYASVEEYIKIVLGGRPVEFERAIPYSTGTRHMRCAYMPELKEDGTPRGFFALVSDVTAQRLAEERTALLAAIVTSSRDAIISITPDGRIASWNSAAEALFGWTMAEAIGKSKAIFVPEDKLTEVDSVPQDEGDSVRRFETQRRRKDGQLVDVSITLSPVRVQGEIVAISEIIRDITERKRAEVERREREWFIRSLVSAVPSLIYIYDVGRRANVFISPQAGKALGYSDADVLTMSDDFIQLAMHPEDRARLDDHIERVKALAEGESAQFEYRLRRQNGEWRWYLSHDRIFRRRSDHSVEQILGVATDITERKRVEEERLTFQALVECSLDYIGMADPVGHCFYLNPAGRTLIGLDTPDEIYSHTPLDFIADADRPLFENTVLPALRRQGRWEGAIRLKHQKTGEVIDAHRTFFMVRHPDSGVTICLGTVSRDMREQKRLEHLLTERLEQLRDADRAKDEFLALLAHELRNPLAPITNAAALIKRSAPTDPNLRWCIDIIDGQLDNMSRMLEDLLDVSRITRGRLELRREAIELAGVLRGAIDTSRPLIQANEHTLTVDLPETPIWVNADATRLSQVVANLLNNAAKYTDPGGNIHLSAKTDGTEVEVRVVDNGHGISPAMLPHIFDMFAQGEARATGGLGIGLTVAKNLVDMHGGKLEGKSAGVGRGSEFILRLPTIAAPERAAPLSAADVEAGQAMRPLRILVVDDNREQAETLGALLTSQGHDVRVASDSDTALQIAKQFVPEVGLIDIGLPVTDGCELARLLRADPRLSEAVLIAQTGWGRETDRQRTEAAGFKHHLVKPINHAVVEMLLAQIADREATRD